MTTLPDAPADPPLYQLEPTAESGRILDATFHAVCAQRHHRRMYVCTMQGRFMRIYVTWMTFSTRIMLYPPLSTEKPPNALGSAPIYPTS